MPTEDNETYCVCVYKDQAHIEDSILTHCAKCGIEVWESLHNADKKPICFGCLKDLPQKDLKVGITPEDMERATLEILKIEAARKRVFEKCLEYNPLWRKNEDKLRAMINMFDRDGDGFKRVTIEGKTYIVPIEDIVCFGLRAAEVPTKYKEAV